MHERTSIVWRVIHRVGTVETVYLVSAVTRQEAETTVLDSLYERNHPVDPPYTAEQLANDTCGLLAYTMRHGVDWSNAALCRIHACSVSAQPFKPDPPFRLYSIDTATGVMT